MATAGGADNFAKGWEIIIFARCREASVPKGRCGGRQTPTARPTGRARAARRAPAEGSRAVSGSARPAPAPGAASTRRRSLSLSDSGVAKGETMGRSGPLCCRKSPRKMPCRQYGVILPGGKRQQMAPQKHLPRPSAPSEQRMVSASRCSCWSPWRRNSTGNGCSAPAGKSTLKVFGSSVTHSKLCSPVASTESKLNPESYLIAPHEAPGYKGALAMEKQKLAETSFSNA